MKAVFFHLNQLGDLIFSLPALISFRKSFPDTYMISVVRPYLVELLSQTGLVDEAIPRYDVLSKKGIMLIKQLKNLNPDICISFSQSASCSMYSYFSGAEKRIGFEKSSLGFLLNNKIKNDPPPSMKNNNNLIESIGCEEMQKDYFSLLPISDKVITESKKILRQFDVDDNDKIVVLSPGTSARRVIKEWDSLKFAEIAKWLFAVNIKPIILGSFPADEITNLCDGILDLSGKTSILQAGAILKRSEAVVSVDSGLLHLAEAVGTRVIGLYGPTSHLKTGPIGTESQVVKSDIECSPCMKSSCKIDIECMKQISSEKVINALKSILDKDLISA